MPELRQSYQQWLGESVVAKRAKLKGESKDPPIPVHLTKEPPFWDVFPENPQIYSLVVQARALEVLFPEVNRATRENSIRYTRQTALGNEKVDVASNWEEVPQILEVRACRTDLDAIQNQVNRIYEAARTEAQKQELYQQFNDYLAERAKELEQLGGQDSPIYAREKAIALDIINQYRLGSAISSSTEPQVMTAKLDETKNIATENPPALPRETPISSGNNLNELKQLMEMFQAGLLTQEEFQAAKAKLLGL